MSQPPIVRIIDRSFCRCQCRQSVGYPSPFALHPPVINSHWQLHFQPLRSSTSSSHLSGIERAALREPIESDLAAGSSRSDHSLFSSRVVDCAEARKFRVFVFDRATMPIPRLDAWTAISRG